LLQEKVDSTPTAAAFSDDGDRFVSGFSDGAVKMWSLRTGASMAQLRVGTTAVASVGLGSTGNAGFAIADSVLTIWNDAKTTSEMPGIPSSTVLDVNPAKGLLAVAADKTVQVWDVRRNRIAALFPTETQVTAVRFSPSADELFAGGQNGTIRRWDFRLLDVSDETVQKELQRARLGKGRLTSADTERPKIDMPVDRAVQYNSACWRGSLEGRASDPAVRFACERAVVLTGGSMIDYVDSRGLNRALNGDMAGAIDDFRKVVEDPDFKPNTGVSRKPWLDELLKGRNPITPAVLDSLK
jgi:WD40 repeat protein